MLVKKIRIKPNQQQIKIIKEWMNTSRWSSNKCLETMKKEQEDNKKLKSWMDYRNELVTIKGNNLPEWVKNTPKDIRLYAVKETVINHKTNLKKLKKNQIKKYNPKYKRRKQSELRDVITLASSSLKIIKQNKIAIYPTYFTIPDINVPVTKDFNWLKDTAISDFKIQMINNKHFYLLVPYKQDLPVFSVHSGVCALDPGVKVFLTGYDSNNNNFIIGKGAIDNVVKRKELINNLKRKISDLKGGLRTRTKYAIRLHQEKIKNMLQDLHNKTIDYLYMHYDYILLPKFNAHKMTIKGLKEHNANLLALGHGRFRSKLKAVNNKYYGRYVIDADERYSSKMCCFCDNIDKKKKIKADRLYNCDVCGATGIDRDINASINIMKINIKQWTK